MGDRQTFQVMPSAATGTPDADREARALPFRHDNEIARAALLRRHASRTGSRPRSRRPTTRRSPLHVPRRLVEPDLRQRRRATAALTIDRGERRRDGLSDVAQRPVQRRHADVRLRHLRQADHGERDAARRRPALDRLRALRRRATVTMRIATSLIGIEQAQHNLELELAPTDTFESVKRARAAAVGREARARSRSRAPPTTSSPRSTRTSTGCSSIRTRRTRTPASARRPRGSTPCSPPPSTPAEHADADGRARRRRQGLRQQRLLGHLPDHLAGVLAAHADGRPASWSTASSSSTATAAGSRAGRRPATRT